jgi:hypothetical protein
VLRFGSGSELQQHLATDHRLTRSHSSADAERTWPMPASDDLLPRKPQTPTAVERQSPRTSGLPVLVSMALVTLIVAALSWQVAVVLTIPLFAAVLFYNERRRLTNHRQGGR